MATSDGFAGRKGRVDGNCNICISSAPLAAGSSVPVFAFLIGGCEGASAGVFGVDGMAGGWGPLDKNWCLGLLSIWPIIYVQHLANPCISSWAGFVKAPVKNHSKITVLSSKLGGWSTHAACSARRNSLACEPGPVRAFRGGRTEHPATLVGLCSVRCAPAGSVNRRPVMPVKTGSRPGSAPLHFPQTPQRENIWPKVSCSC